MILRSALTALCLFALPAAALAQAVAPATTSTAAVPGKRSHTKKTAATTATAAAPATTAVPTASKRARIKAAATVAPVATTTTPAAPATVATPAAPKRARKTTAAIATPVPQITAPATPSASTRTAAGPAGLSKSGKPRTEKQLAADAKRKACAQDWQAAKTANTTGGKTWPQFLSACYKTKV